MIESWKSNQT